MEKEYDNLHTWLSAVEDYLTQNPDKTVICADQPPKIGFMDVDSNYQWFYPVSAYKKRQFGKFTGKQNITKLMITAEGRQLLCLAMNNRVSLHEIAKYGRNADFFKVYDIMTS